MARRSEKRNREAGVALLTALAVLALFALLGTAWMRFMVLENGEADRATTEVRARLAARAGVQAAIGNIEAALARGDVSKLLANGLELKIPVYKEAAASGGELAVDERFVAKAAVSISDECARINLNHVPVAVLMQALDVSGAKARQIRNSLPSGAPGRPEDETGRWFATVDELVTRSLLTTAKMATVDRDLLTVYTVPDPANASGFINVNTLSAKALEAVLGVTPEVAQRVAAARPFASLEQLSAASGKDPASFNVKAESADAAGLPKELTFSSRCYRLVSQATLERPDAKVFAEVAKGRLEAVVYFADDGRPRIMYWSEAPEKG